MVAQDERDRPANVLEVQQSIARISQQAGEHTMGLTPGTPPNLYAQPTMPALRPDLTKGDAHAPTVVANAPLPQTLIGSQRAAAQPALSPWKTGFITLMGVILAISLGASAYALSVFNPAYGWALVTESLLALLLTLITGIGSTQVQSFTSRLIMLLTALVSLIASGTFAVAGSADVQALLFNPASLASTYINMFNLLFTGSLTIAAILSLYWLLHPYTMMQRIILFICFGLALACFLTQMGMPIENFIKHLLLLVGLIALVLGTLLATQLERVQKSAQITVKQAF
jgi:hypothetical protein